MIIAVALLLQTTPAASAVKSPPVTPASTKIVCRTMGTTGSRLGGKRVCATKADWDQRALADRQMTDLMSEKTISDRGL